MVRQKDQLREFDPLLHGGIVIDDVNMAAWPRESRIMIADWDEESAIDCRYSPAIIPKHTKIIITSNVNFCDNMLGGGEDAAIRRRFTRIIHITGKTYLVNPPLLPNLIAEPLNPNADIMNLGDLDGLFPADLFDGNEDMNI